MVAMNDPPHRVRPIRSSAGTSSVRVDTERRVAGLMLAGRQAISQRLRELDDEWNLSRAVAAHAGVVSLLGLLLGSSVHPRFRWLTIAASALLLENALVGRAPTRKLFERMGLRATREIQIERQALKALRGDFDHLPEPAGRRAACRPRGVEGRCDVNSRHNRRALATIASRSFGCGSASIGHQRASCTSSTCSVNA